jgi:hypothetical protein
MTIPNPDELHRLLKLVLDTGEVSSPEAARKMFEGYRLVIEVGPEVAASPTLQAAVLTGLNTSRRTFLGGVEVIGNLDTALGVRWGNCRTLLEAVHDLQGSQGKEFGPEVPRVVIGSGALQRGEFSVRATFDGWSGGVLPLDDGRRLAERQEYVPAGVLSGAIAVSEAFQFVRGGNVAAGRRALGISLWRPEVSWLESGGKGPVVDRLPARLWLIGLGHLGQAFLWTLGLLPYAAPEEVEVILQDYDTLTIANDSTSLLTNAALVGQKKTRAMAAWCERRGFRASINERRFATNFEVSEGEPNVALCGVDNALARASLEEVGFARVIEAGLGAGTQEYLAFQLHTFPGASRTARERWSRSPLGPQTADLLEKPAYRTLSEKGMDDCGLVSLAGRTVGASFVGSVAAALAVSELQRMVIGATRYELIDGTLRSLEHLQAKVIDHDAPFNPGWTSSE